MRRIRLFLAISLVMAWPTGAKAQAVELVTGSDYPPFAAADMHDGGLYTHVVRRVYEEMDVAVSVDMMPWKRGYARTREGEYTATFPYVRTEEREREFLYSAPLLPVVQKPVVPASADWEADEPADLAGRRYCLPTGWAMSPTIRKLTEADRLTRVKLSTPMDCMRLLRRAERYPQEHGVPTFVTFNTILAKYLAGQIQDFEIQFLDLVLNRTSQYVIFPRNKAGIHSDLEKFNKTLEKMKNSGKLSDIVINYIRDNIDESYGILHMPNSN